MGLYTLTVARKLPSLVHQRSTLLTTVLAQDHFYSDFLSLHVSVKTNNKAMMMFARPCAGKGASDNYVCRLEDQPPRSEDAD